MNWTKSRIIIHSWTWNQFRITEDPATPDRPFRLDVDGQEPMRFVSLADAQVHVKLLAEIDRLREQLATPRSTEQIAQRLNEAIAINGTPAAPPLTPAQRAAATRRSRRQQAAQRLNEAIAANGAAAAEPAATADLPEPGSVDLE